MTLKDYGINTKGRVSGQFKTTCPKCSHTRRKKKDPCLSVNIDEQVDLAADDTTPKAEDKNLYDLKYTKYSAKYNKMPTQRKMQLLTNKFYGAISRIILDSDIKPVWVLDD